jgi:hypothetical protein
MSLVTTCAFHRANSDPGMRPESVHRESGIHEARPPKRRTANLCWRIGRNLTTLRISCPAAPYALKIWPLRAAQKRGPVLHRCDAVPKVTPPGSDLPVRKPPRLLDLEPAAEVSQFGPFSGHLARHLVHNGIASADQEAHCDDWPRRALRPSFHNGPKS